MNQVLVRTPQLHGRCSRMVPADVLSTTGDTLTVKMNGVVKQLPRSQTVPLAGPNNQQILQLQTPSRYAFAKSLSGE